MARYDHIDFTPPAGVRSEAQKGLDWRNEYGRGGTAVGVARARDLSNGTNISPETAKRMKAYFDRHEVDKQGTGWSPGDDGFPSAGRVAWALWGGDAGRSWSSKLVKQINAADDKERSMSQKQLPPGDHGDIERRFLVTEADDATVPMLSVETRAAKDGDGEPEEWIVGYAARFGVESLNLGDFVERIDPGAFSLVSERRGRKNPLMTRALFNHDPNFVLGRFPDTLRMTVDDVGLRYEVLPPASQRGVIESIKRGDIRGSSFAFVIAKGGESWHVEEGRHIRTVTAVSDLMDVGPVTYPAYPDSSVSVAQRSFEQYAGESVRAIEKRDRLIAKAKEFMTIRAEHMEWLAKNGKR